MYFTRKGTALQCTYYRIDSPVRAVVRCCTCIYKYVRMHYICNASAMLHSPRYAHVVTYIYIILHCIDVVHLCCLLALRTLLGKVHT